MNTLDVLYKNRGYKASMYGSKLERNDDFIMTGLHTDDKLERLFREANINIREKLKKESADKEVVEIFHKHPRNFDESDLLDDPLSNLESSDSDEIDKSDTKINNKSSNYVVNRYSEKLKFIKMQEHLKTVTTLDSDIDIIVPKQIAKQVVPKQEFEKQEVAKQTVATKKYKDKKPNQETVMAESEKIKQKSANREIAEDNVLGVILEQTMFKIAGWIQEINSLIYGGIKPPEDSEDYLRREKCTIEFSSRFSRQYSYQFNRQLESLNRLICRPSALANTTNKNIANTLNRCLTNACHNILNAVQAYCHHVPYTIITENTMKNNSVHEKFIKMMNGVSELCDIIKTLSDVFLDVKDILSASEEVKCNSQMLATVIQENLLSRLDIQTSTTITTFKKSAKTTQKYFNPNDLPYHKRYPLESRLSMYCVNPKRKPTGNIKSANNKNPIVRPRVMIPRNRLVSKPSIKSKQLPIIVHNKSLRSIPLNKSKMISNPTSSIIQAKINDDEIETMVQMNARTKQKHDLNFEEDLMGRVKPLVNNLVAQVATDNKFQDQMSPEFTEELINSLHELFLQMAGGGLEKQVPNTPQLERSINNSRISVTGVDNAKLIVVKDKSMFEPNKVPAIQENALIKPKRLISNLPKEEKIVPEPILLPASRIPYSPKIIATNSLDAETIEIKRRKRNKHNEITIGTVNFDKKYLTSVLTYRNEYMKFTQQNPLYRKGNGCITPWDLGLWISEKLLNSSIAAVLMEINNINLPDTVYLSEFQ